MAPEYPALPLTLVTNLTLSVLTGKPRSFRQDSQRCVRGLAVEVIGDENIPQSGPGVIVFNHYSRPGFNAWWIALSLSATIPVELHWTMTAAWTETGSFNSRLKAMVSKRLFPRLAEVYGFTAMPPMPPRPYEASARARAVRQVLAAARRYPPQLLALAPEGQDSVDGSLMQLHPGVGRFLALLGKLGCPFYPLGVYESPVNLCLNFGLPFVLQIPPGLIPDEVDVEASRRVMSAIATLIPESIQGYYRLYR